MKKELIGLNRYIVDFSNDKEKQDFIKNNKDKYDIEEIFVNNGYCLEIKKLKIINLR